MARAIIETALNRLGVNSQLAIEANADRGLLFVDDLRIEVSWTISHVRLEHRLCQLPDNELERLKTLEHLLHFACGNMVNLDTAGETVSICPDSQRILLFRLIPVDQCLVDEFPQSLSEFVDSVEYWQQSLQRAARVFAY